MDYAQDKQYIIPAAFTALNGSAQTFVLTAGVDLVAAEPVDPKNPTEEEIKAIKTAQANLLRVLEVLRSNGAQPIITKVEGNEVTFTVEQSWVWGHRAPEQVSVKKLKEDAIEDIKGIFGEIKDVDDKVKLLSDVDVLSTIGALEEDKAESESSAS